MTGRYRGAVDPGRLAERFGELTARREPEIPLDEAALLIAAHRREDVDVSTELGRLDELAEGCFAPTLDALVAYLFGDLGFAGNRREYYDPRNSYLDQVVERRLGIPISLGVLTMVLGRRLGVPLIGIGMPGHFLLRDQVDPTIFVDPFGGGRLLDRAGCERAFHHVHGPGARFDDAYLAPVGTVSILTRMLANLRNIFGGRGDRDSVVGVLELRNLLPGATAEDRGELAAALAAVGRFHAAADEYEQAGRQLGGELGVEYQRNASRLRARLN
jgi:regulator of sirC expression with transglutaminase-like and TPR domain